MSSAFDPIHEIPVPIVNEPVHKVVVPDEDVHVFGISHPNHVSLIQSPIATEADMSHGHHSHPEVKHGHADEPHGEHPSESSTHSAEKHERSPDEPVLKRAHEAPTIQLFFDLYFVANLTTFSGQHEIHDANALRSYLGYFTMIWFTWFQNTMFDVRFSNDSVFERICKVCQFGVMTGFAITGPGYQTGLDPASNDAKLAVSAFQTLSLILMTSRLILTFQYGVALFWLKSYKKAFLPMLGHMLVLFTSAMIFLGLYFGFTEQGSEKVLAGWYVTFIVEAWLVLIISGRVPFLSFRHTVLVERLGLLTLIILGEGIISMSNALNAVGTDNQYGAPIIGQIICCVVVAYLMYMLYFDNVQPERMGSFRQHIWAVLHFPFHASVVLVVEAMAQMAIWQKVVDVTQPLIDAVNGVSAEHPTAEQVTNLENTVTELVSHFVTSTTSNSVNVAAPNTTEAFDTLSASNSTSDAIKDALNDIYGQGITYVCAKFKIEVDSEGDDNESDAETVFALFEIVYIYFFAFAGLVLIVLSVLFLIGKRHKLRGELMGAALRFTAGVGLALLSTMASPTLADTSGEGNDNVHHYMYSGMVLPTVLIVYLVVLVLDNLLVRYIKSVVHWRLHLHHHKNIPEVERPDYSANDATAKSPITTTTTPATPAAVPEVAPATSEKKAEEKSEEIK